MIRFLSPVLRRFAVVLAALLSPLAMAQGYFALNYDTMFYEQPDVEIAGLGPEVPPLLLIDPEPADDPFVREDPIRDLDLTLQSVRVKYGYSIFSWLSVEARSGIGASKQTLKNFRELPRVTTLQVPNPDFGMPGEPQFLNGAQVFVRQADAEIALKYHIGAYVRLGGNFDSIISPYLIWGRSKGFYEVTANVGTGGGRVSSASYGAGFNIRLWERTYFNLEYMDLFDTEEIEVQNWSGGFEYRF